MDIEYIVQKLKAKRIGIGSYQAHCPNHDDSKASLSVSEKNGQGAYVLPRRVRH